jgi:hypothetical protein
MALFMQPTLQSCKHSSKLRLQNGLGTEFSCLKMQNKPKVLKFVLYLYEVFAGVTGNEPKSWHNLKSILNSFAPRFGG